MKKVLLVLVTMMLVLNLTSCGNEKEEMKQENVNQEKNINQDEQAIKQMNEEISDDIKEITEKVASGEMTDEEAEEAMIESISNTQTFKNQLEKSKYETPRMLKILKMNRECLADADSKSDAIKCMKEGEEKAKKEGVGEYFGADDDETFNWDSEIKEQTLKDIDDGIEMFEIIAPCIDKAETLTDMMQCSNY